MRDSKPPMPSFSKPIAQSGSLSGALSRAIMDPQDVTPAPAASTDPSSQDHKFRAQPRKRKGHRGGKKKRLRRKSFAALADDSQDESPGPSASGMVYQLPRASRSDDSLDSEALLDHREQQKPMRIRRRSSVIATSSPFHTAYPTTPGGSRLRAMHTSNSVESPENSRNPWDETIPLLSGSGRRYSPPGPSSYGASDVRAGRNRSRRSSRSSRPLVPSQGTYDVNHPPSVPASPTFGPLDGGPDMTFVDVMIRDDMSLRSGSPRRSKDQDHTSLSETEDDEVRDHDHRQDSIRRPAAGLSENICFPVSDLGDNDGDDDDDTRMHDPQAYPARSRRRRSQWPDLSVLEEWRTYEKEDRSEERRRVKRITEPQLINGRLRPVRKGWFQTDEEAPYRFTYFNEECQSTIHSQSISELIQPGGDFRELFIPDPRVLSDDESSDEDEDTVSVATKRQPSLLGLDSISKVSTRQPSVAGSSSRQGDTTSPRKDPAFPSRRVSPTGGVKSPGGSDNPAAPAYAFADPAEATGKASTPSTPAKPTKSVRYGDRPVWWLDVFSPTEAEMKVIAKAFGIHPLTAEDIMLQEAREKVELFRHYYFVNYRTFDQDINSDNYLEPVNMYVVVFREGVLSFHFSMTPHPANVRRRIRQLRDYLILSSDWISYAIIDDITDVFQPLIQNIEDEVDEIDDAILRMHMPEKDAKTAHLRDDSSSFFDSGDMLRRVGDCRKRVMSLYRLLGNKADVIKGFSKRCNERWQVAPRSEIGLYLGDIQDHIVTMTSNLGHYEKILARSHGNYLAQINIRMNERQEQTADVLGKLTVLGTIVLPMNIITGLWGMNVWVPGQEYEGDLAWFAWITAGLLCFGLACYLIAKRVYNIV
ncbi:hypothetical protein E4U24_002481 [Claviceps purpurea]|nr:hypothetical protein E4U12_008053 [Claviceps purpurea]KAG6248914.1 hypothetical protein E4U24_002481 [Claviceps purpurea]